jgi:hypothetical protein
MATYTAAQLYGSGSIGENLSGLKTFTFTNPSASSYFTLEAVRTSDGFYTGSSAIVSSGSFTISASMVPGFVTSSNVFSLVIPQGTSVFTFTPANAITGTTYYLRGTGAYSLTIS